MDSLVVVLSLVLLGAVSFGAVTMYWWQARNGRRSSSWGLIPTLAFLGTGIVVVAWLLTHTIETRLTVETQGALASVGADWARPKVEGRWVHLGGTPPSIEARDEVLATVRSAIGPPRVSGWIAAPRLTEGFDDIAAAGHTEWTFRVADGVLTLSGQAPTAADADALGAVNGFTIVRDRLRVSETGPQPGWLDLSLRGIGALSSCDRGVARFSCGVLSVQCQLPAARVAAVEEIFAEPLPMGTLGAVALLSNEALSACEQSLSTILDRESIVFATVGVEIDASSDAVLDQVAEVAATCPGILRIEGHTDDRGDEVANQILSDGRAEAVRAALLLRGLDADRLVAEGFAARRPRGTNQTRAGRARNRRIEIRVVRAPE